LDGLEDKDELVVTLARAGALDVAPAAVLVPWDASRAEVRETTKKLFAKADRANARTWPVLKAPCGSRGDGISLAPTADAVCDVLAADRERAVAEGPAFLEWFRQSRRDRRGPAYVLQEHVDVPVRETLRVYVLVFHGRSFVYSRAELRRVASSSSGTTTTEKDLRSWFLTNGNCQAGADRRVLQDLRREAPAVSALVSTRLLPALSEEFAERAAAEQDDDDDGDVSFAFGALDLIVDAAGQPRLLEVNRAPAAPPDDALSVEFRAHLIGLASDLVRAVTTLEIRRGEGGGLSPQEDTTANFVLASRF